MRFILLLLLLPGVFAATLHGNVYDVDFNLLKDVVVKIDTVPEQTLVSKDGSYSFEVPNGDHSLTASIAKGQSLQPYAQEYISIDAEGTYVVDLFTFPEFGEEEELDIQDIDVDVPETPDHFPWRYVFLGMMVIGALLFWFSKKRSAQEEPVAQDLEQICALLKSEGGRINQKDLRKSIPLSEAKISLMVTELESKGRIQKIRKGRANILLLKS